MPKSVLVIPHLRSVRSGEEGPVRKCMERVGPSAVMSCLATPVDVACLTASAWAGLSEEPPKEEPAKEPRRSAAALALGLPTWEVDWDVHCSACATGVGARVVNGKMAIAAAVVDSLRREDFFMEP